MGTCREIGGDKKSIDMVLPSGDAADYLNFVLKDASTNTWYDSNGSNFQLALRTSLRSFMSMDDAEFVRTPPTVSCVIWLHRDERHNVAPGMKNQSIRLQ